MTEEVSLQLSDLLKFLLPWGLKWRHLAETWRNATFLLMSLTSGLQVFSDRSALRIQNVPSPAVFNKGRRTTVKTTTNITILGISTVANRLSDRSNRSNQFLDCRLRKSRWKKNRKLVEIAVCCLTWDYTVAGTAARRPSRNYLV